MIELDSMIREAKFEYAFSNFYEYNKNGNNELRNYFFLVIASLFTNLPLPTDMNINISNSEKLFIIDCAYKYRYDNMSSLKGPLLNTFGEILDSNEPYIEPYLNLMRMVTYNKYMKK